MKTKVLTSTKNAAKSVTIQGAGVSIISTIGTLLVILSGGQVPAEIQNPAVATAIASIIASVVSIYGRIAAKKTIMAPQEEIPQAE